MIALALFASSLFHFDTAKALYRAEQYENALKQLDTSEQLREPAPLRPLYRGKCLAQLGKWQDVQAVLEPFLITHPDNADGWYWLGASHYYVHRLDQSLVSLDKALELRPGDADAYRMRGLVYIRKNRWNDGYQDWLKSARLNPRDVKTLYYLGRLFQEAGQTEQAKLWLTDAVRISPRHYESLTYLAMCEGDTGRAVELFSAAIEASVDQKKPYSWAYLGLGQLHRRLNQTEQAHRILEAGVRLAPEPHLLNEFAKVLIAAKQPSEAERLLRRALSEDPSISEAHYQLGRLLAATGRRDQANAQLDLFRKAKEAEANKPRAKVSIR